MESLTIEELERIRDDAKREMDRANAVFIAAGLELERRRRSAKIANLRQQKEAIDAELIKLEGHNG